MIIKNLFNEALENEKLKNWNGALKLYAQIIHEKPDHFESWLNSGAIYTRFHQFDKSMLCYKKALEIRKDIRAYYNFGLVLYQQKILATALDNFLICLKIDPDFIPAVLLAAYSSIELDQVNNAIKILKNSLIKYKENESLLICLVIAYNSLGKKELCDSVIQQILSKNPMNKSALRFKARLSIDENVSKISIENFRKLINSDPEMDKIEKIMGQPENSAALQNIMKQKNEITKKKIKSNKDYLDLSLVSFLSGNGNAAMNYLLYAVKEK